MTRRSPAPRLLPRAAVLVILACGLVAGAQAQSLDEVGLFFAPGFPVNEGSTDTFPAFDTAYLVLMNPSLPDIGGWELRVAVDGPGTFLGWQYTGQAVNFLNPPQFVVGLGSPIPAAAQVVLAQSDLVITADGPVRFSLHPVFIPSLPGEMSYIPFEDKEPLTPLATWTGTAEVAAYNGNTPICDVSVRSINFGTQPRFSTTARTFTVTNVGGGVLPVDAVLDSACTAFRITSGGGSSYLSAGERLTVRVEFRPLEIGEAQCVIDLGTGCDPVSIFGAGREPIVRVSASPSSLGFGEVYAGQTSSRYTRVTNTGEVAVTIDPVLDGECLGFSLTTTGPITLQPGVGTYVYATFAPLVPGARSCTIVLGDGLPTVPMTGTGVTPPNAGLTIIPESVSFGTVAEGSNHMRAVTVANGGPATVSLQLRLAEACAGFIVWPINENIDLAPGDDVTLNIQFRPPTAGVYSCRIALGPGLPDIPVSGTAATISGELRLQPANLDFGGVAVGSWTERTVTVINETNATVTLLPSAGDPADGFTLSGSQASITLPSAGRHTLTVKFQPTVLGAHSGVLSFGGDLPTVPLAGTGEEPTDGLLVEPTAVDFGTFYIGAAFTDRDVYVTNTGNAIRYLNIRLTDPFADFSLLYGGPQVQIMPGQRHRLLIRFSPNEPIPYADELLIGDEVVVPVTGVGVTDVPRCFVHATNLEFGTVLTGATSVKAVYVTNTGGTDINLVPGTNCDDFIYVGTPLVLVAGQTAQLTVAFNPSQAGEQICILDLGPSLCQKVILWGEGSDSLVPDHDLVGVWFDEDLTTGIRRDLTIGESVPAWVAMLNPSEPAGVSGWELRLDLGDGLHLTGHQLAGQAFNIEQAPSFFVGLGTPLPYGPQVLLATFEFLVTDTELHSVDLVPLWRPSIPGGLAWVYGEDFQLKEMFPVSGTPSVAWLSAATPVAVTAPTPLAALAGGRIELRWPLPTDGADGCHVYRTLAGRQTQLTSSPLPPGAGGYLYVDDPTGLPAGATVGYSYGIVRGGAVVARSPEVTVELPGAGTLATRLLPNRPNPFNPETELHFTLERAGSVRLAVYDVTGRRIAVLEDGVRAAGAHRVTWRGRDDAGRTMPSGAYYVRLETAAGADTRKIMLLK